jgi:uncharacterized protein (TIGR00295 family)
MIPTQSQAIEIHRRLGSAENTIQHCQSVANLAKELAEAFNERGITVDAEIVYAAGLLHDIGRTKVQTIHHGYIGAELVQAMGVDVRIAKIISRHVGAGISNEEARKFGFPDGEYVPQTLEEKIVCFCDKLVGPRAEMVPFEREVEKFKRKNLDFLRLESLKASLQERLGEDPELLLRRKSRSQTDNSI